MNTTLVFYLDMFIWAVFNKVNQFMLSPFTNFDEGLSQTDEIPLSLRDKIDSDADLDFFAMANDDFDKPLSGLMMLDIADFNDKSPRRRFISDDFNNENANYSKDNKKSQFTDGDGRSSRPRIANYVCEVRRLLK